MERTEKIVQNELLGKGPRTVEELRSIHNRIQEKNIAKMERREELAQRKLEKAAAGGGNSLNPLGFFTKKTNPMNVEEEESSSSSSSAIKVKTKTTSIEEFSIIDDSDNNESIEKSPIMEKKEPGIKISGFSISDEDDDDDDDNGDWLTARKHFEPPKDLLG